MQVVEVASDRKSRVEFSPTGGCLVSWAIVVEFNAEWQYGVAATEGQMKKLERRPCEGVRDGAAKKLQTKPQLLFSLRKWNR
jgi:hypothetical protein